MLLLGVVAHGSIGGALVLTPVSTAAPEITGSTIEGQTLACSTGTWLNDPDTHDYQWLRDDSPIEGATADQHILVTADVASMIACEVTATNEFGFATVTSAAVGPIQPFVEEGGEELAYDAEVVSYAGQTVRFQAPIQSLAYAGEDVEYGGEGVQF